MPNTNSTLPINLERDRISSSAVTTMGDRKWRLLALLMAICCSLPSTKGASEVVGGGGRGRLLLGFTVTKGNSSFQCSPSGPCLPCQYSEKVTDLFPPLSLSLSINRSIDGFFGIRLCFLMEF